MRVHGSRPRKALSTRRRRAGGYAWLAALTMTALAVMPLCAIFHQISAPHAVCEHGELVESGDNRVAAKDLGGVDLALAAGEAATAPTSAIDVESAATVHGHSHCSVGTLARSSIGLLPPPLVLSALSEVAVGDLHYGEFVYVRTILLAAPKTSPPHAAS